MCSTKKYWSTDLERSCPVLMLSVYISFALQEKRFEDMKAMFNAKHQELSQEMQQVSTKEGIDVSTLQVCVMIGCE